MTNRAHMVKTHRAMLRTPLLLIALSASTLYAARPEPPATITNEVIVSVKEQKLMLLQNGAKVATYPVSTSKFGLGDRHGSMATPLGVMKVAQKIGDHAPNGAVFHHRRFTGEILKPNAPGRDPIITRILWLRGLEARNAQAFSRAIYIHGTTEEKKIGKPASYGCIRMKSKDVATLYSQLPVGATVQVVTDRLPRVPKAKVVYKYTAPDVPVEVGREPQFPKPGQAELATRRSRSAERALRLANHRG